MDTKEINAAVKCAVETTQQPPSFSFTVHPCLHWKPRQLKPQRR